MQFFMVDVATIRCAEPNTFPQANIETAARKILDSEGLLSPLVLKKTGLEKYEVVSGVFEYYAAAKARELDPVKGEMVNALVIAPAEEKKTLEQLKTLKGAAAPASAPVSDGKAADAGSGGGQRLSLVETRLANVETRDQALYEEIRKVDAKLDNELQRFRNLVDKTEKASSPLEGINTLDRRLLSGKLARAGLVGKRAEGILDQIFQRRKKGPFESLEQLTKEVKGFSPASALRLVDNWNN
jgi:DNA uptake protein ComE-like DNA-binding protein